MSRQASCKERVQEHLNSRMADLKALLDAEERGEELEDLSPLNEYGLSFDYVEAGTFTDQKVGYFCYLISTGGPGEELRIYTDARLNPGRVEFWLLDWCDGASLPLKGKHMETFKRFWDWLGDTPAYLIEKSKSELCR